MEPLPKYLEYIATFPTPKNISDVCSWFGLVNQVAHYAQLRDMVTPLKPLLSSKAQFYWTNELEESFSNSKQEFWRHLNMVLKYLTHPVGLEQGHGL